MGSVTFTSPTGITVRIVVGVVLVMLGLIQWGLVPLSFHVVEPLTAPVREAQARLRRRSPVAGFGLFGFGYLLIAFG